MFFILIGLIISLMKRKGYSNEKLIENFNMNLCIAACFIIRKVNIDFQIKGVFTVFVYIRRRWVLSFSIN